jgi:hypothetical protein
MRYDAKRNKATPFYANKNKWETRKLVSTGTVAALHEDVNMTLT